MKKFNVKGMTCSACSARVEKSVSKLSNVEYCSVNLLTNTMEVEGTFTDKEIIDAVIKAGYSASLYTEKLKDKKDDEVVNLEIKTLKNRLLYSLVFLAILMYISMGYTMLNFPLFKFLKENPLLIGFLQMALAIVVIVINKKFYLNGFKGAIKLSPNMDTLVSLGSFASFIYSVCVLVNAVINVEMVNLFLHDLYFESSAMILALITLGKLLESYSKGKTTKALKSLEKLAPNQVAIIKEGKEVVVPFDELQVGDVFVVRPGENIPADGTVVDGSSAVDESALSGESIPLDKKIGDKVSSATTNLSGVLYCKAEKVGEETTLSQIIKMVSNASASKAPINKIADKVSGVFVPIVMAIALITTIVWLLISHNVGYSLARGISVLVISCPCALGLATPVAIMVGSGIGAKNGILFKSATALEVLGKVKIIALDKTGTITVGKPKITDIISLNNTPEETLLQVAYSLEYNSEHPISKAIISHCQKRGYYNEPVTNFEAVFGGGVYGEINNKKAYGGNLKYISLVVDISKDIEDVFLQLANQGKTPLLFVLDNKILGVIAVADTLKPKSVESVKGLKRLGIRTIMLTGDNEKTAKNIARSVGADQVIADVLPQDKGKVIESLKKTGLVAMVGDGINDAIALTTADVGIAIGAGTDVAINSAEVVLINSSLEDLVSAVNLSKATLKTIRQNLFWAFFYNVISIPIAIGVLAPIGLVLNPIIGAFAMSLSSVFVVTNALRLNLVNIKNIRVKKVKNMVKTLIIEGMMCPHCEARVKKILEGLSQIDNAEVDFKKGEAKIFLNIQIDNEELKSVIENEGYKVINIK